VLDVQWKVALTEEIVFDVTVQVKTLSASRGLQIHQACCSELPKAPQPLAAALPFVATYLVAAVLVIGQGHLW
jgi:hypothetical protein